MNILNFIAVMAALLAAASLAIATLRWFLAPLPDERVAREMQARYAELRRLCVLRRERMEGHAPTIYVPKKYGPLGVRGFRALDYFRHMMNWRYTPEGVATLANIGTVFRVFGTKTYYPTDCVPQGTTNPYNSRYMLVQQAPAGSTLGATLAPAYAVSSDDMCQVVPSATFVTPGARVPLGFMTDEVGNNSADAIPYSGTVALLCGGARATLYGIADSVIAAGGLLVPSLVTNGYLGPVGNIAGVFWCVGAAGSTSEGAGTGIEVYQNLFPVSVDEIT